VSRAQQGIPIDSTIFQADSIPLHEQVENQEEMKGDPFAEQPGKQIQVTPRKLPPGKLEEIKKEKKFWYADSSFIKKEPKDYRTPFFMRDWVKTIFWILVVGGFAVALAWYLYNNNIRLFRKKDLAVKPESNEDLPESIFDIDYDKELKKALQLKNHRLAVRLQFLGLLRLLAEKGFIQYRQDRTNMDYIFQLGSKSFHADFFRVVRHYEYSWYGEFEVSPENYTLIETDFQKLKQQLN
jgi:hypothetical protein